MSPKKIYQLHLGAQIHSDSASVSVSLFSLGLSLFLPATLCVPSFDMVLLSNPGLLGICQPPGSAS
jgi:hypothetical protein